MRLPVATAPERVALQANDLNRAEAQGDTLTMLLGAWCPDPNSDTTLAYRSLVPNALPRWMYENLICRKGRGLKGAPQRGAVGSAPVAGCPGVQMWCRFPPGGPVRVLR